MPAQVATYEPSAQDTQPPAQPSTLALPRVIVRRGNGQGVEMPALDVVLDSIAVEVLVQKAPQRSRIQERSGVTSAQNCSKGFPVS